MKSFKDLVNQGDAKLMWFWDHDPNKAHQGHLIEEAKLPGERRYVVLSSDLRQLQTRINASETVPVVSYVEITLEQGFKLLQTGKYIYFKPDLEDDEERELSGVGTMFVDIWGQHYTSAFVREEVLQLL